LVYNAAITKKDARIILIKSFLYKQRRLIDQPFANKLALASSLLCLCSSLVLIAISQQHINKINQINLNQLGSQLSQQLAINARPALIKRDSLSLQSLLDELTQSETISQAAIYNIDNKPIAEAGDRSNNKAYTAAIHYQDTIAGHSLIIVNSTPLKSRATGLLLQQLLLSLLLSACCYALTLWAGGKLSKLFTSLQQLINTSNYPGNTRRKNINYLGDDELQGLIQQILKGPSAIDKKPAFSEVALLHIELTVLDKHNQEAINESQYIALQQYQQRLTTVCKLYEGQLEITRPLSFTAFFYQNKDDNDHPFKALCCGKIIEKLFSNMESTLTVKARAMLSSNCNDFAKQQSISTASQAIINQQAIFDIDNTILKHLSVGSRIDQKANISGSDKSKLEPIQLNTAYSELIERQFSTLQLQFDRLNEK